MAQSAKVTKWDGKMKNLIRTLKVQEIKYAKKEGRLCENPVALTLAGAKAHFEVSIHSQGLVNSADIITIQSPLIPSKEVGSRVLRGLVKLRDESLPGMMIWPETFKSFCEGYREDTTYIPSFSVRNGNHPAWYKSPTFRAEMYAFCDKAPRKLSVVDADLCGIFSKVNGNSITSLMKNNMLADEGVLFINHQKGRDGQCVPFLQDYFHHEGLFDIDTFKTYYDDVVTLTLDNKDKWDKSALFHAIRSTLVPVFYVIEAFRAGYRLEPIRLAEYRDKNTGTGVGVNMLQWFFRFEKLESKKMAEGSSILDFSTKVKVVVKEEVEILKYQLKILADEAYLYEDYVD